MAKTVEAELLEARRYRNDAVDTGQQWDAPNGWAPLQWIAVEGLRRLPGERLAETIACRWMAKVDARVSGQAANWSKSTT